MRWRFLLSLTLLGTMLLGTTPARASTIEKLWTFRARPGRLVESSGGVLEGSVFALVRNGSKPQGSLVALDAATGVPRWRVRVSGTGTSDAPVIAGNVVLLGVGGGVTAFDPVTGIERWHTDWACGPGADIATARQAFYVSGFDICKVNLRTHRASVLHRNPFGGDDGWDEAVAGGRLLLSFPNNGVWAFSTRTGRVLWKGWGGNMSGDSNTLLIQGPRVFVGKVALDLATGEPATGWTDPGLLPIDGRATAASGVAFFPGIGTTCPPAPCSGGIPRLQSVDAATGNLRWNTQLRRRPVYYQTLVVLDGVVYVDTTVPGGGSRLQGIDQATGTIDATIHTPSVVTLGGYLERAGMFASGSTVFINGSDRLVAEHVGT